MMEKIVTSIHGKSSTKRKIFLFFLINSKSQYNNILNHNSKVIQCLELYVTGTVIFDVYKTWRIT